jgi:hypothetical protein
MSAQAEFSFKKPKNMSGVLHRFPWQDQFNDEAGSPKLMLW